MSDSQPRTSDGQFSAKSGTAPDRSSLPAPDTSTFAGAATPEQIEERRRLRSEQRYSPQPSPASAGRKLNAERVASRHPAPASRGRRANTARRVEKLRRLFGGDSNT